MNKDTRWDNHKIFNRPIIYKLVELHSQPHRKYHNLHHIEECFEEFEEVKNKLHNPLEVEIAIWFHDAIYYPQRNNNEEKSATLLGTLFKCPPIETSKVQRLILSTKRHHPYNHDSKYFLDIDMSILGKDPKRYREYTKQVREEFSMFSDTDFIEGRSVVLNNFLKRKSIYNTTYFQKKYETQAIKNIKEELVRLQQQKEMI